MIKKLDESTITRIAAGEVIERPASVVKELVENAFDAGAKAITVRIEEGGMKLIEVADDGAGIPAAELPLAIERHATSKIVAVEDLDSIRTMGFRGEALAAIAAAAGRLTIISRAAAEDAAMRLDAETPPRIEPCARSRGTTVLVRELFARTPARLKFMKSETAETGRIAGMTERLALARPDVALEFQRNSRRVFHTAGRGRLREVVAELFGPKLAAELLEVNAEGGGIRVEGLISPPHLTRRNRTGLHFFIGHRPFDDRAVAHAVTSAYEGLLAGGLFPLVFLHLDLDPAEVDVNVHPAKAEVRFRDPSRVHRIVSQVLRERLRGTISLPAIDGSGDASGLGGTAGITTGGPPFKPTPWITTIPAGTPVSGLAPSTASTSLGTPVFRPASSTAPSTSGTPVFRPASPNDTNQGLFDDEPTVPDRPRLRYAGEIRGRFLLAESPDGLVLVDQHAAHERILFDRLMREAQNGEIAIAPLLAPIIVEATATERLAAERAKVMFEEIGMEIEVWPDSVAMTAIPAALTGIGEATRLVRAVIESLLDDRESTAKTAIPYERIARAACKAAVKGTERLHEIEAKRLLEELERTTDPYRCPHGRPTMIRMTIEEIDRRFGRT
jgi:DNA mismatch repair protein MutL